MTNPHDSSSDDTPDLPRLPDLPSLPDLPIPQAQQPEAASEPEQEIEVSDSSPPSVTNSNKEVQATPSPPTNASVSPSSTSPPPPSQGYSAEQIPTGPPPIVHSDPRFTTTRPRQESAWEQKHLKAVRTRLQTMGVLLMVSGMMGLLATMAILISDYSSANSDLSFMNVCWTIMIAIINLAVIYGGLNMYRMKNRAACLTGAICAVLPCSFCFFLTIPIGIIALVILNQSNVKHYFLITRNR